MSRIDRQYRIPLRRTLGTVAFAAVLAVTGGTSAHAVIFIEQAQRLERIYAALLDLRPGAPPDIPTAYDHPWDLGMELIPVPAIDNRVGSKDEPVHPPPVIPRARLRYDHAFGESLGGMAGLTYEPPLMFSGYTADWLGGEAALALRIRSVTFSARIYVLSATVAGPVTGPGTEDRFTVTTSGADARVGVAPGRWRAYLGYGAGHLDALLRVGADGARIREEGDYTYALGGIAYAGDRWRFTLEQQATENYLRHVILGVSWRY